MTRVRPSPLRRALAAAALLLAGCAGRPAPVIKLVGGQLVEHRRIHPDAYEHAARALLLEEAERYEEAADEVRRALTFDRDSPELWAHLAELLVQLDRLDDAATAARESLERGETPRGLVAAAHVAQARGDAAAGVESLRRAAEVARGSVDQAEAEETRLELADAQAMALDVEGGAATLRQLCADAKMSTAARVRLAAFAWALGAIDEAVRRLVEAITIEPNLLDARLLLAWLHASAGRAAEARAELASALDRSEGAAEFAAPYARYLVALGKLEEARQLVDDLPTGDEGEEALLARIGLERVVKRPERALAMIAAHHGPDATPERRARLDIASAGLLEAAGRKKEAATLLLKIPRAAPGFLEARLRAATLLRAEGKTAEAERALVEATGAELSEEARLELVLGLALVDERARAPERALRRLDDALAQSPKEPRLLLAKAAVEERRGRWREALAIAAAVRARDPSSVEALNFWGFVAADHGHDLPRATRHVRAALALEPGSGAILDSLGWALFRAGDLAGAEHFLEQAARLEPEDPEILAHLAQLYAARGERSRAEATFKKVLTLELDDRLRQEVEAKMRALAQSPKAR